jgi:hypothetical protein
VSKQDAALAALSSGGITERAEAVRQLGRLGDLDVLDELVERSLGDKSPGVRLAAAAAAADVLARYRLVEQGGLDPQRRAALMRGLRSIDPGRNTGLFQILACLGDPSLVVNLARGARDPRVDVRTGALVGLERLACSGLVNGDERVVKALRSLLGERRVRPDALLEAARIALRTGLWQLRPDVEALRGHLEGRWLEGLDAVLEGFPEGLGADQLLGCWCDRGLDCGEQRQGVTVVNYLVVLPGSLLLGPADAMVRGTWELSERGLVSPVFAGGEPQAVRTLRSWYDDQEGHRVLQIGRRSYGRVLEKELPALVDQRSLGGVGVDPLAAELAALLEPELSGRPAGSYTRAVLHRLAGEHQPAAEQLLALAASKRVRPELHWQLHLLNVALGDRAAALASASSYLEAAKRGSPFIEQAKLVLGE